MRSVSAPVNLECWYPRPTFYDPDQFGVVLNEIRRWIETTEGDGFLEIGASQDQV